MRILSTSGTKAGRKALKASASMLGLAAGAIGWSGLAHAASEENGLETLLLPDHYRLMDDGVVVFKLEGGEELSLNPDQYVILQDGLLLITDELAQASMESLPVMGAIRSQLMSDVQPIRSPDGTVVLASDASPLWSGDGPSPRLFEEVDIERFELASHSEDPTAGRHDGWNPVDGGLLAGGLLSAAGLLSNNSQEPEDSADSESDDAAAAPPPPDISSAGAIWMDSEVPDAGGFSITGTAGSAWIGYTEPTAAATDAITEMAKGSTAIIDMSASGPTKLDAGDHAALTGSLDYKGGSLADTLEFGGGLGKKGSASFDMSAGGNNTLTAGNGAGDDGSLTYTGGPGSDDLSFGHALGSLGGSVSINTGDGDNSLYTENAVAAGETVELFVSGTNGGRLTYVGGNDADSLTLGLGVGSYDGTVILNAGNGDNTLDVDVDAAAYGGSISYTGGTGSDDLTFGANIAGVNGSATLDLGDDTAADTVTFQGTIGDDGGSVTIKNFNYNHDTINVSAGVSATAGEITSTNGDKDLTWTDSGGQHTIVFAEIGSSGTGVQATTAQLIADII